MGDSVYLDSLEKIFAKVEQEAERRADQQKWSEAVCSSVTSVQTGASVAFGKMYKDRQGGIVRVTEEHLMLGSRLLPQASSSQIDFYETQTQNGSVDSTVGAPSESNYDGDIEDNMHATQVPERSISSKSLPRRPSRSHYPDVIPIMGAESSSESVLENGMKTRPRRSRVQAPGRLPYRYRSQKSSVPGSNLPLKRWISKVKVLMHKLSRKPT